MHISLDTATDQLSEIWVLPPYETPLYQLRMDVGDIHELQIPTCSYRMGTPHTGYGLVYIGRENITLFSVMKFVTVFFIIMFLFFIFRYTRESDRVYNFMAPGKISSIMDLHLCWNIYYSL